MTRSNQAAATLLVDADNTLWDTDAVFARAQLELLAGMEHASREQATAADRLGLVREVDQALAERHHDGLRYPPQLLARGLELVLLQQHKADAAARLAWRGRPDYALDEAAIQGMTAIYLSGIARSPEARPGVVEGLRELRSAGHILLIVSESKKAKVEGIAERLGIGGFFERVIEGIKSPSLFRRVVRLTGTPERGFMIGDQLDRDIIPAKAAGLETIYYPGGFRPRWALDHDDVRPDHTIETFAGVPAIVSAATYRTDDQRRSLGLKA